MYNQKNNNYSKDELYEEEDDTKVKPDDTKPTEKPITPPTK